MTDFQLSIIKGSQGEILVYGNYLRGNEPIFIERVVITEFDTQNNAVGSSSHHLNRSIDPVQGTYLLVSKMPFGSNSKAAQASGYYIVVDKVAKSATFQL